MKQNILYRGKDIAVYSDVEYESNDILIITFTPRQNFNRDISSDLTKHAFAGSFLSKQCIPSIHFIASWNHWWQTEEMQFAIQSVVEYLKSNKFKKIWMYSSSMGATGVLMSAGEIVPYGIVIISPQFSIDPKIVGFDNRFKSEQQKIDIITEQYVKPMQGIRSYIIYDNNFELDNTHAEMTIDFLDSIRICVSNSKHAPAQVLLDCGMLTKTILSMFYENFYLDDFKQEFHIKRFISPIYLLESCKIEIVKNNFIEANRILKMCDVILNSKVQRTQPKFVFEEANKLRNKISDTHSKIESLEVVKSGVNNSGVIFDGEDLYVVYNLVNNSKITVVTFSSRAATVKQGVVDINSGFGAGFLSKNNISSICFVAKWNHWWQTPEFNEAIKVIKDSLLSSTHSQIWTYGASMGGTGALMAALPLNAHGVISIVPQWSVDLNLTPFEPRWLLDRKLIKNYDNNWERPSVSTKVFFIYDPFFDLDYQHIKRLTADIYAKEIHIPFAEHAPPSMLREIGLLSRLILSLLNESFSEVDFSGLMRLNRSNSIMALTGASALLLKKNKGKWALKLSTITVLESKKLVNSNKRVDYTIISRSISNHLACLVFNQEFDHVVDIIKDWSPVINGMVDFTRFKLQAGLRKREPEMVFDALMTLWSREGKAPTPGMIGSTISAIKTTLREDQIKKINDQFGDVILNTSYAIQYKNVLSEYLSLKFTDTSRNVAIGTNGYLFLTGGYHSVLDYITQRRLPDDYSFDNFSNNIEERTKLCNEKDIKYLHVIFPDKQSVLKNEFPLSNCIALGDEYISRNEVLDSNILYPKELLSLSNSTFLKLDTHMSDFGYIDFLSSLLERLEESYSGKIEELKQKCTKEVKYAGDLGSKTLPPTFDVRYDIVPDWDYKYFNNGVSLENDGVVDIYLNSKASSNKRVFIFGDSFFRRSSLLLSYFFQEVVFFRTRYFHKEIVEMGKPDIVLTGQAERYLSVVDSDDNAPVFLFYPYLKGVYITPSKEYSLVMNAILSYGKPAYDNLMVKYHDN